MLTGQALVDASADLGKLIVPSGGQNGIRAEGLSTAVELHPTLRYDEKRDVFVRITDGTVFHNDGRGSFVGAKGEQLLPGWKVNVGFHNFSRWFTTERCASRSSACSCGRSPTRP